MGPGPGGHGRAAVDEPRVTANWNEYACSGTACSIPTFFARGSLGCLIFFGAGLGLHETKQPGRTTVTTTACFRGNSNLSFPGD